MGFHTYQPAVRITSVHKVELSPFQWRSRFRDCIDSLWLHPSDVSCQDDITFGMLAGFAGVGGCDKGGKHCGR